MANAALGRTKERSAVLQKIWLAALNVVLGLWFLHCTVSIVVTCLPVFFCRHGAGTREKFHLAMRRFVQFYGRSIIRLFWPVIRVSVENVAAVQHVDPCVYVLNHFSFIDVFFCGFLPGYQTVIAIRSWPFHLPVFNFFMRGAGYMDVEANGCEEILSRAAATLRSGGCLLFFPEGHRSRNGRLQPLRKGAFRIAAENGVPIVPVTIEGTENLGGFKSRWLKPSLVRMRFHPPLEAGGRSQAAVLSLRRRVEALYQREVGLYQQRTQRAVSKE